MDSTSSPGPQTTRAGTLLTPTPASDMAAQGTGQQAAQQSGADQSANPIIVRSSALDTHVPVVQQVNEADIKARFPTQHIDPIDGEPTYE